MNFGRTLFAQLMEYVPWTTFRRIIGKYSGDAWIKTLDCIDIFKIMAFAQLTWRESLRDIEICLTANQHKLYSMGIKSVPARSTLSDGLNGRNWKIYYDLATNLIAKARKLYEKETINIDLDATIYALDSTTIDLCLSFFDWAPFRTTKAAIKLHTLLDLRGSIPAFIHISDGKMSDVKVLDILPIESGAFYVMDRGYVDFARLYKVHQFGAFFVTRSKRNTRWRRIYSNLTDRTTGVICDQIIVLATTKGLKDYSEQIRRIKFIDKETGKTLVFITNNKTLPALTIAALYKNRWQVELFFKWIKQHLRIKKFFGTSENAVKAQIWCAIATYVLIAIVKQELKLKSSLYTLLQILSVTIFEKIEIYQASQPKVYKKVEVDLPDPLGLFDI
jgi:hypothetical protein